jgi:hypothetical protein
MAQRRPSSCQKGIPQRKKRGKVSCFHTWDNRRLPPGAALNRRCIACGTPPCCVNCQAYEPMSRQYCMRQETGKSVQWVHCCLAGHRGMLLLFPCNGREKSRESQHPMSSYPQSTTPPFRNRYERWLLLAGQWKRHAHILSHEERLIPSL